MKFLAHKLLILCMMLQVSLEAEIVLPRLIGDNMVLQRDTEISVWGWASPGEKIVMQFVGKTYETTTDDSGKWALRLKPTPAGGPHDITLKGTNQITLKNIVFGDVWLCSGQSNMVHQMKLHRILYAKDIASANYPDIRHFAVPTNAVFTGPVKDFPGGSWQSATPESVREFTAVGYFFALDLHQRYGVPIGLINASVGGSPIEAWISEAGLREFPDMVATVNRNRDTAYVKRVNSQPDPEGSMPLPPDRGTAAAPAWYAEELVENENWRPINVPGFWEDQGLKDLNGTVWYRKYLYLPLDMAGKEAEVFLGRIVDADELFINGKRIGGTGYQYPQRRYPVPAGLLRAGQNLLAVRVTNFGGKGGFVPDRPYQIFSKTDTVDLKGTWSYRVGQVRPPRKTAPPPRISLRGQPASFYNGMIAPATNYGIKGVLWYQGESNAGRPKTYARLQAAQIQDFRTKWGDDQLPFLFVQLPGFQDYSYLPEESNWAALREAQRKSLRVPHTGMAVAIDLGEWNDIHPDNKKDVGLRLARLARQRVYGESELVATGPMPRKAVRTGDSVMITFTDVGKGLVSKDGEALREFALAGYDGVFHWAQARIQEDRVVLKHPDIKHPRYVRYAWSDNPQVNLYNQEGLPASPFELTVGPDRPPLWRGKKATVVLTYDDALNVHLDEVIPALDRHGIKATFYLSAAFPGSKNRLEDWRRAAAAGHELGNHTLYHPCDGSKPGRDWVSLERDLSRYSTSRLLDEVAMTNVFLESLDGKRERTFAYPCGDTATGEGDFTEAIAESFLAARGVQAELNAAHDYDLHNFYAYGINGQTGDELISMVKNAEENNALIVFLFHGVGGEHNLNVSTQAHQQLIDYLAAHQDQLWVTTMITAAKHLKSRRP
ncbi:sialate O-acetylesterase [Lewinella sp. W8]|uniref:sialate O-acetylesterase n=1 Tax=Lewinella sp. W8 TaxID=2528208 RepID=UPI0010683719|nr:sialate O-acetylesterase [Lewinella sp. W8]MTB50422.1 polysaccharide deacetylase family protein [Lewinella sp. W8]